MRIKYPLQIGITREGFYHEQLQLLADWIEIASNAKAGIKTSKRTERYSRISLNHHELIATETDQDV